MVALLTLSHAPAARRPRSRAATAPERWIGEISLTYLQKQGNQEYFVGEAAGAKARAGTATAVGTTTALGTGGWHNVAFTLEGSPLSATADGVTVGSTTDSSYTNGQAGLGVTGYGLGEHRYSRWR